MKGKKPASYIILSILLLLTAACVFDKSGGFDPLRAKYEEEQITEELKSLQSAKTGTTDPSEASQTVKAPDTDTGASQPQPPATPLPSQEDSKASRINILANQSVVSIVQSGKSNAFDIDSKEIADMVRNAVELAGGLEDIIKDGQVVVLKPNLVQIHSDITGKKFKKEANGITTDWRITKAVVQLVREYNPNGRVYVMEGSAGDRTKTAFEYMNYTHEFIPGVDDFIALEDSSGSWQEFNSPSLVKVDLPDGLLHKQYYLNKIYKQADVLISLPCLKNNSGTVVTGGIKNVAIGATPANIYGLSPGSLSRTKMVSHSLSSLDLHQWIYDFYMCKPVDFVIMDGLQGFQNGPAPYKKDSEEKDIMNMRVILAGKDAVALDTIESLVAGWDPLSAKYLRYLNASNQGNIDTTRITVLGKKVDEIRKFFHTKIKDSGGIEITDTLPPEVSINKISSSGDSLSLAFSQDKDTAKIELLIDDILYAIISPDESKNFLLDINGLEKGSHELKALAYDRFLNHSELKASFIR